MARTYLATTGKGAWSAFALSMRNFATYRYGHYAVVRTEEARQRRASIPSSTRPLTGGHTP